MDTPEASAKYTTLLNHPRVEKLEYDTLPLINPLQAWESEWREREGINSLTFQVCLEVSARESLQEIQVQGVGSRSV